MFWVSSILALILVIIWGLIEVKKNHVERSIAIYMDENFIQASDFSLML